MKLDETLFVLGNRVISLGDTIFFGSIFAVGLLLVLVFMNWRSARARRRLEEHSRERSQVMEQRLSDVMTAQAEMAGRLQTVAEVFGSRQQELTKTLGERMDSMTHRLGQNLNQTTQTTQENLKALGERLAVIDKAQSNITQLSGQVVELQNILANKQTRGAFGQARMEAIILDGLPQSAFGFQETLTNGNRPDCLIFMPNDAPALVVDAKFPLEGWNAVRSAENPDEVRQAQTQFRRDVEKHIKDISERYFINGETQDTAFMFVPSESIFADIHEHYEDVIQKAHRARVVLVSPSLLMLSIQVVQSVLRDQRMREQAHIIQKEVIALMQDVHRLDDRVNKLQVHFQQSNKDIEMILTSTKKITNRGGKIEALEFENELSNDGQDTSSSTEQNSALPKQQDLLAGE